MTADSDRIATADRSPGRPAGLFPGLPLLAGEFGGEFLLGRFLAGRLAVGDLFLTAEDVLPVVREFLRRADACDAHNPTLSVTVYRSKFGVAADANFAMQCLAAQPCWSF